MSKKFSGKLIFILFVILIAGLFFLNQWIQKRVGDIVENPNQEIPVQPVPPEEVGKIAPQKRLTGEVFKKIYMAPDRSFEQGIFYQDGQEIARHRVTRQGKIYDQTGTIPDGKVQFVSETNETYGAEFYKDGQRHGPMKVYYKDGALRQEAYYQFGKLVTSREYAHDGSLRMEVDYSDAREYDDGRDVGVGKVYFRDGRIKYEWKLTKTDPVGWQKSYNRTGALTGEVYFDGHGDIIPSQTSSADEVSASSEPVLTP
jgi:antitoxin component YwqK of YwqJK toxin-antitoxin module